MSDVFRISSKEAIPINKDNTSVFIPAEAEKYCDVNKTLEKIAIGVNNNIPILLAGETGTGKTSAVKYLAYKTQNSFRRVNHNGATTVDDIVGKILVNKEGTYWIDGVLTQAMRTGGWYLADEINACSADILFAYHSVLENDGYLVLPENNGEIVKPHKNFRFFATFNPSGDYLGVKELNKALISRFMVVKVDYPAPIVEARILVERTGIKPEVAEKMVKFAGEIRASHAKDDIQYVCSTRDLLMFAKMYRIYKKYLPSAECSILNKVHEDNYASVKDLLALHFKGLDSPQTLKKDDKPTLEATSASEKILETL